MSVLTDLRVEIADALAPLGINTYTHIPAHMSLPAAFVMAGSPYVEQGQTFGEKNVRFTVVLCTQTGTNESETSALDELIEEAQAALDEAGWVAESISQPNAADLNDGGQFLATEINVTSGVTFN